jgi:RHS repeat-associated core domain
MNRSDPKLDSRTVPGTVDIVGIANPTAPVKVNLAQAVRQGEYFRQLLSTPNSGAPWFDTVTVDSTYGSGQSENGTIYVPKTPELFTYDADGNLTRDGRWDYTWDGENRLIKVESLTGAPTGSKFRLEFAYDDQGRRIWKKVTNLDTSVSVEEKFVYDGWNLIGRLNAACDFIQGFAWGSDLSGTMQGAGGVGGLLWIMQYSDGTWTDACFAAYDGNGNVVALIDSGTGNNAAVYEYGPFGELIRQTGSMAKSNPFRFSTKYQDNESDLVYYGYRYYNASTGRWPNRDPIAERGGLNLYGMVGNDPLNKTDYLGWGRNDPGGPGACNACCACPDSITIKNVTTINGPIAGYPGSWWGHGFDVEVCLTYTRASSAGSLSGPPSLQWFERSSRTIPGIPPNTWNDMFVAVPNNGQAQQWNNRKEPCPGKKCFTVHDTPAIAQTAAFTAPQHLEFKITVNGSCSTCIPMSKTVTAVQDLTLNANGTPATGTFTVSP